MSRAGCLASFLLAALTIVLLADALAAAVQEVAQAASVTIALLGMAVFGGVLLAIVTACVAWQQPRYEVYRYELRYEPEPPARLPEPVMLDDWVIDATFEEVA